MRKISLHPTFYHCMKCERGYLAVNFRDKECPRGCKISTEDLTVLRLVYNWTNSGGLEYIC